MTLNSFQRNVIDTNSKHVLIICLPMSRASGFAAVTPHVLKDQRGLSEGGGVTASLKQSSVFFS